MQGPEEHAELFHMLCFQMGRDRVPRDLLPGLCANLHFPGPVDVRERFRQQLTEITSSTTLPAELDLPLFLELMDMLSKYFSPDRQEKAVAKLLARLEAQGRGELIEQALPRA
jgi:hypothetical protein